MSSELIVSEFQSLTSGGYGIIELFELDLNDTSTIYFTNQMEAGPTTAEGSPVGSPPISNLIQFRDRDNPDNINVYYPIPSRITGIEHRTEGQLPRPTLTIANVLKTGGNTSFQGLISNLNYEDLLGQKVVRRRTTAKYLYGAVGDSNPPVELPSDVYYLDRIENENSQSITFTLVSPVDLDGVKLPRRQIIGNACAWKYKGAAVNKNEWEKEGGCTWHETGVISRGASLSHHYINQDDEYIIDADTFTFTTWSGGSANINDLYRTAETNLTKIESNGTLLAGQSDWNYWMSKTNGNTGTPSDSDPNWLRVRIYNTYSSGLDVNVYTDDRYNSYFVRSLVMYKAKTRSQDAGVHWYNPESSTTFWEAGDKCGKRVRSCAMRFGINPTLQLPYDNMVGGFTAGRRIVGQDSGDSAYIISDSNAGTTGTLFIRFASGPFINNETILEENPATGAPMGGEALVNISGTTFTSILPNAEINDDRAILPYGGFPTARAFS